MVYLIVDIRLVHFKTLSCMFGFSNVIFSVNILSYTYRSLIGFQTEVDPFRKLDIHYRYRRDFKKANKLT